MQELDIQPTNPTPYTPAGGMYNFNPRPGAGGLPSLSGLTRNVNPMAQQLQGMGRGDDKMLVHMTPDEINDLQTLAMNFGTTMTVNPNTGLPEAGLLGNVFKKLLPALAGAGLMFIPGVNAIAAAGIVGGGSTLLTGSLKKGLMAGLSAYGGASLARGLGAGVQAAKAVGATTGTGIGAGTGTGISATRDAVGMGAKFGAGFGGTPGVSAFAPGAAGTGLTSAVNAGTIGANAAKTGLAALPGNFAKAAQAGLPKGIISKAAPMLAASGLLSTASKAAEAARKPGQGPVDQGANWPNEGPYMPTQRILAPRLTGPGGRGEIDYFYEPDFGGYLTASGELRGLSRPPMPQTYASQGLTGFAEGGEAQKTSVPNTQQETENSFVTRVNKAAELAPDSFAGAYQKMLSNATDAQRAALIEGRDWNKTLYDNKTSGWVVSEEAQKKIDAFKPNDKYADVQSFIAGEIGFIDPITKKGKSALGDPSKSNLKPGEFNSLGDKTFTKDEQGRWKYAGESVYQPQRWMFDEGRVDWASIGKKPTTTTTTTPPPGGTGSNTTTTTSGTGSNTTTTTSGTGSNTSTNTATSVIGYEPNTPTSKVVGLPPGATPDSYGVYTLKDRYTPQFTKVEDFVTEKVNPYTGGTEQTNKLEEYIKSYRTSPGPLKSTSLGYAPGQSPSERNRAYALELAKQAEAQRRAAATTTTSNAAVGADTGSYYYNPADGQTYANPNFTGAVFNPVTGRFEMPAATGPGNARGGTIHMDDGAFVVDARTVSELGNGSSSAGQELLARLGGRPVKGPGDGVSDSIRANIGGTQEARVARDEVIFPAKAVKKLGGAKKLYALMDKAHKARKKAGRGTDTKLRKGLGAL